MKIKRIEVFGFKSFADRTEIELGEGLTAIVGPNGSGKSNIADAVKWVLGEQSPRVLRGSRMEDVIFGGTAKRKSVGFAEVTIVFDNSSKLLPLEAFEVMITRRVFRNQESEYLINRRPCRLKDITELFLDTGIGRDSYSFVGQGRIEEIISADPRSRRVIFEEAAGISRYKMRKRETEARLSETDANICRVRDISAELSNQLTPLNEEADRARQYLLLCEKREALEGALIQYEIGLCERQTQSFTQQVGRIQEEFLRLELSRSTLLTRQATATLQESELLAKIQDIEKTTYEKKFLLGQKSERRQELTAALERAQVHQGVLSKRLAHHEDERLKVAGQIAALEAEEALAQESLSRVTMELRTLAEWEDTPVARRKQELKGEIAAIRERMFLESGDRSANEKRLAKLLEQMAQRDLAEKELLTKKVALSETLALLEGKSAKGRAELKVLEATEQGQRDSLAALRTEQKQQGDNISRQQSLLFRMENRWKALKSSEEQMEGLGRGTKFVLKSALKGLLGVVGDLVSVPVGLETAIESALGGAVSDIVALTERQAKDAIKLLKESSQGRATFYPLDALRPRAVREVPKSLTTMPFFRGRAVDLVSSRSEIRPVIEHLLGNVLIVDDLEAATQVAGETGNAWRIVTLDGDIRLPSGSLTGGSRPERQAWLLMRKREIEDAENEVFRLHAELRELEAAYSSTQAAVTSLLAEEETLRQSIEQVRRLLVTYDLQIAKERAMLTQIDQEKAASAELIAAAGVELTQTKLSIERAETLISNDARALQELLLEAESQSENSAERQFELQVAKAKHETMLGTFAVRLAEQHSLYRETRMRVDEVSAELLQNQSEQQNIDDSLCRMEQDMGNLEVEIDVLAGEFGCRHEERLRFREAQREITSLLEKNSQEENSNRQKMHNAELRLERLKVETGFLKSKFMEGGHDKKAGHGSINNRGEAETALAAIDEDIRALGSVRVSAIDECTRISERVAFLAREQEDLERASGKLKEVLANLDAIMGERFLHGFNQVKTAFQDMVGRLFGGATSRLFLLDRENPLDSGIEIDVQPVGKKLQNISLLSGGERALVAIALVCSVLKVKPTPFCVLDEIDAPLDDANVERLIAVLRELSTFTQFLLITHTKGTMIASDVLYGVTMPEQGVSKVLSVRMSELAPA